MRSIAEIRSSSRRSIGRGTAVDKETVVDSKAASVPEEDPADFLRISDVNMFSRAPSSSAKLAPKWDFMDSLVKRAFHAIEMNRGCGLVRSGENC
ncbi:MAG TPA: hypothetical protein VE820_07410 [Sphingomicrobium sp.]|jgi:hypothetical protein|nr:hypothetical protein [Sphingomicrobium sp.]